MNPNNDHDDLESSNAPLEALLRERVGKESPPDLARVVAARHARGDGQQVAERLTAKEDPVLAARSRPLLTAALVLLGIGAVIGTLVAVKAIDQEAPTNVGASAPDLQDPPAPTIGSAFELQVVDRHGGPVQNFRLSMLEIVNTDPVQYRPVATMLDVTKTPRDFTGAFTRIDGLIAGTWAVAITDDMHALTVSDPFEIKDATRSKVTVKMNVGGIVRGTVRNRKGDPIANATVQTQSHNFAETARFPMLRALFKAKEKAVKTERKTKTDKNGAFEMKKLAYGGYVLHVEHPDYCPTSSPSVTVTEKVQQVAIVTERGTEVFGRVLQGGKAAALYEVRVSRRQVAGKPAWDLTVPTDATGYYRLGTRVRPGEYKLSACKQNHENPFDILLQLKQSQRTITIQPGQDKLEQNLKLN